MKIYQITIFILFALTFGACSSTQSNNTATLNQPINESSTSSQTALAGSPTEVLKTFTEATKKKDVETVKKTLSKSMMKVVEETAKKQNISVDEMLMKVAAPGGELKNEKIEGDSATVEIKNEATGEYDEMPFVKEDGSWKIALDVFMNNVLKKINEVK